MANLNFTVAEINDRLTRAVLVDPVTGDVIANIVPRADTLANLQTIIGANGELASATDQDAIVKYDGVNAGGVVFRAGFGELGSEQVHQIAINAPASLAVYSNQIEQLSFNKKSLIGSAISAIIGFYKADGTIAASYNGVDFFTINLRAGSASPKYATDGLRIVETEASTSAWYLNAPYSTWATYTGALHASNTSWTNPIMCGTKSCLVVDTAGLAVSAIIDTTADSITQLAMNAGMTTSASIIIASPQYFRGTSGPFAIAINQADGKSAVLKGASIAAATWSDAGLPLLTGSAVVMFTRSKVLVHAVTAGNVTAYVADYDATAGTLGAWATVTLPTQMVSAYSASNLDKMFFASGSILYSSNDGETWEKVSLPFAPIANGVRATLSGVFLTSDISGVGGENAFVRNTGKISTINPARISSTDKAIGNYLSGRSATSVAQFFGPPTQRPAKAGSASTTGTINIPEGTGKYNVTTAAQAALTVNLPPNPTPGMEVMIRFVNSHTALTIGTQAAPASQTINGAATLSVGTNTANQVLRFTYHASNDWSIG